MTDRLDVLKTYKLFIDGKFPRSESGRSLPVNDRRGALYAHLCLASRKDLRDAVEAARKAQTGWAAATAYNRGQILYRMAEMMEGRRSEFVAALDVCDTKGGRSKASMTSNDEVKASVDRLVCYAGWADKYAQVLGCNNPVSGPFYNFTVPEPAGVIAVVAPDTPALLGLISLLAPAIVSGNTAVVVSGESNPIPAALIGEVFATSDLPPGVVNILTGLRAELLSHVSTHRDIDGVHAAGVSSQHAAMLRTGVAENLKRVKLIEEADYADSKGWGSAWRIEPFVEIKTMWHPASVYLW
ncbi:MAG: aldehyde dehydrogenase family protein [Phycisphaerales bacterium]